MVKGGQVNRFKIKSFIVNVNCIDQENGISFVEEYNGRLVEEILSFKDKNIKRRLIELGWTPPKGVK